MTKMAKNKNKKQQPKRVRTVKPNAPGRRPGVRTLDAGAQAYARLLLDPCDAPLVHPVYSGSEGGYLFRAEAFTTYGAGAGLTGGFLQWTPGLTGNDLAVQFATATTSSTAYAADAFGTSAPGYDFLRSNASAARCVAACMKISYPGSESGRSGRIHIGQASGCAIVAPVAGVPTYTVDQVAQLLPHYTRTPAQEIEIVWKPNDADQLFRQPEADTTQEAKSRMASLLVAWTGLPAAVGITVRFTAVFEWQPEVNRGMSVPNLSKSPSNNTLDEVINMIIRTGQPLVRGMAAAGTHGIMGAIANAFGNMPALMQRRSVRALAM